MSLFRDARLKIDRANKHIRELDAAVLSLHEAYISSIEEDANTGGHSIKYECPYIDERLADIALIAGDAFHNLRTALDYAWVAIVKSFGLPTKYTKFPFCENAKALDAALAQRQIDEIVNPALFKKLTADIKPYRGGNVYLWGLHEADITDKHKLVLPIMGYAGGTGIRVEDEHGITHEVELMPRLDSTGVMYIDFAAEIKIKEKGHISFAVLLHKGALAGSPIPFELQALSHTTLCVVQSLESLVP